MKAIKKESKHLRKCAQKIEQARNKPRTNAFILRNKQAKKQARTTVCKLRNKLARIKARTNACKLRNTQGLEQESMQVYCTLLKDRKCMHGVASHLSYFMQSFL